MSYNVLFISEQKLKDNTPITDNVDSSELRFAILNSRSELRNLKSQICCLKSGMKFEIQKYIYPENWWKEALTCSCSACGGRGRLAVFYSPFSACQLSGNLRGPSHRGLFMKRTLEQQTRFDLVELPALLCAYF